MMTSISFGADNAYATEDHTSINVQNHKKNKIPFFIATTP